MAANNNGKFINAFQSFQMIGGYDEEPGETDDGLKDKKNEPTSEKDDLYDPLESMQDSDDEQNTTAEENSSQGVNAVEDVSDVSDSEIKLAPNQEEFSLEKSPEQGGGNDSLSFIEEDDELLGNALAELEEEEKERQHEKDKGDSKKKKKKKDKEDKKKKKKKKKKKGKDKIKDKDKEGKEERKEKKKSRASLDGFVSKDGDGHEKKEKKDKHKKDKKSDRKRHRSVSKEREPNRRHSTHDLDKFKNSTDNDGRHRRESEDRHRQESEERHKSSLIERLRQLSSDTKLRENSGEKEDKYSRSRKDDNRNKSLDRKRHSKSPDHHSSSKRSRHSSAHEKSIDRDRDRHRDRKSRSPIKEKDSDRKHTTPRGKPESKPLVDSSKFLRKDEFVALQREARIHSIAPDLMHSISSGSSPGEQQRLVIEDSEIDQSRKMNPNPISMNLSVDLTKVNDHPIEQDDKLQSPPPPPPPPRPEPKNSITPKKSVTPKNESESSQEKDDLYEDIIDFKRIENDMYDVAISSQPLPSRQKRPTFTEPKKATKPGALSINEYKERKRTGKDSRLSSSSQSEEESKTKRSRRSSQSHSKQPKDEEANTQDRQKDKTDSGFNESKENISPAKQKDSNGSPYNPEASPLNLIDSPEISFAENGDGASPSQAAVEDNNVDIMAYKDVLAFENIMKSKVKHEAKKHKRKKLEEMQQELEKKGETGKEKRMVDYMLRQQQVEEIMKNTLKTYFKAKEITKDEYKYILKKAVPQVTMSSSVVVAEKIESLMVKFVRKCKGQRPKHRKNSEYEREKEDLKEQQKQLQESIDSNTALLSNLEAGGFEMTALNPNLPLPPV